MLQFLQFPWTSANPALIPGVGKLGFWSFSDKSHAHTHTATLEFTAPHSERRTTNLYLPIVTHTCINVNIKGCRFIRLEFFPNRDGATRPGLGASSLNSKRVLEVLAETPVSA
jgi:hypothetical protein